MIDIFKNILFRKNVHDIDMTYKKTRNQALKLLLESIVPILQREGFVHRKNGRFWHINPNKTDVIEIRFLLNNDPFSFDLPLSSFSLLGGCYFNFFPNSFNEKVMHQIPNFLTPDEVHCHIRITGIPNYHQSIFKKNDCWWHLDCEDAEGFKVVEDVISVLKDQFFHLMNSLNDISEFLKILKNENKDFDSKMSIGNADSYKRHYLLGFTYVDLGDKKLAINHLMEAKKIQNNILSKLKNSSDITAESPIIKQLEIINKTLEKLNLQL